MAVVQTIQTHDIGLEKSHKRRIKIRNTYATLVAIHPIFIFIYLFFKVGWMGPLLPFKHKRGSDILARP